MTRADAEAILRRWGWTPERIAALPDGRAEFIAEDVPRDTVFLEAALAAVPVPAQRPPELGAKTVRALAEIRRVALGDKRLSVPIGPVALTAALENIAQGRKQTP